MENVVVENGKKLVESSKNVVTIGSTELKKMVISSENRWKSTRNHSTNRLGFRFNGKIGGGVGLLVSLYTTFEEMPFEVQLICYTMTISIVMITDPFGVCSRVLAKISRYMIVFVNVLLVLCVVYDKDSIKVVFVITLILSAFLIYKLNDFWIKEENWKMSREVEHCLHGDPDNKASRSWHGDGRKNTRTILYSLGYTISDTDLDSIMKAVYSVGFWNCLKRTDQDINILKAKADRLNDVIEKNNSNVELIRHLRKSLDDVETEKEYYKYHMERLQKKLKEERPDIKIFEDNDIQRVINDYVPEETEEEKIDLPNNVSMDQYQQVCELLEKEYSERDIAAITELKRNKVRQCKALYLERKNINE